MLRKPASSLISMDSVIWRLEIASDREKFILMDTLFEPVGVLARAQTIIDNSPFVVCCDVGESFDYQPERHFFAVPLDAPSLSYAFSRWEKVVPGDDDPSGYAWQPVAEHP